VARHIARLGTRLVAPLVVDYSALRRLVVDYFASTARPSASARRAARHAAEARRSSSTTPARAGSSSTTSLTPRIQVPRHVAPLVAPLVVD
jgi:hypothetical protein